MTVKELEKIVTAKVNSMINDFKKITPVIAKVVQEIGRNFQKIDIKAVTNKVNQSVQLVKNKIKDLKNNAKNSKIAVKVNNEEVQKQVSQIEKQIDSLQKKISARHIKLNFTSSKLNEVKEQTTKGFEQQETVSENSEGQRVVSRNFLEKEDYSSLSLQKDEFTLDIMVESEELDIAKSKVTELQQEISKNPDAQNKFSGSFNLAKDKIDQAKKSFESIKNVASKVSKAVQKITAPIKAIGSGLAKGLGYIVKHVASLFDLKNIYSTLKDSANSWLSSQNSDAQQLSANIEYMKYAMGGVFAPVIEYVVGLVYQLMKAIQSVVYAFSGINIFAKSTASSMNNTASSASKINKSLGGIHSDINNVSENDSSGGSATVAPNMDLSQMDSQMSGLDSKLYDFFKPLKESWDNYGTELIEQVKTSAGQVGGLVASVWGSFENIITNGTVYSTLENILGIIGNISDAFKNAWNYNGNGDAIVQNLANAFNNLLTAIDNVVKSEGFQNFLKLCSDKFRDISEKIESIDWQPLVDAIVKIGENVGTIALEILSGLVDIFKWLVENPIVAEILLAIAIAISVVSTVLGVLTGIMSMFNATMLPITVTILAIIAVITAVILIIMNWGDIIEWIKEKLGPLSDVISQIFGMIWDVISTVLGFVWDMFSTVFTAIWNIVSPILNALWNTVSVVFTAIWNIISPIINTIWITIKTVLEKIKEIWTTIWNALSNIVIGIWNGIWNTIKKVINSILSGIESFANGIVKGINRVIEALNSIKVNIPDWVPIWGGKTFGLNLRTLNEISLPRLAKGNVAYSETMAIFGEYAGASTNPEITTPQNIMRETFEDVLANRKLNNSNSANGEFKQLVIQFGSTKVALEIERLLQQARRQNGTAMITI